MRSFFPDAEVEAPERHLHRFLQIGICMQTDGRVRNKIYEIRFDLFTSVHRVASTEDVDDVEHAIEIRSCRL